MHMVFLLAEDNLEWLFGLNDSADHDQSGDDEVGLSTQAELKDSFDECLYSTQVIVLFDGDK